MANKFANILGFLGLKSGADPVTEAHLQAADDKIAQLEQDKAAADRKAEQAEAALTTAKEEKTTADTALAEEKTKVATLEEWKKNQAAVDGREQDESNSLDGQPEAQEAWEQTAASTIAATKRRLGVK